MSYPSSGDDEDRPPAKRAKVFRACTQCVASKTRCEDVKPKGCWLCRRKRKECSLAGAIPTPPTPPPPARPSSSRYPLDGDAGGMSGRSVFHPPTLPTYASASHGQTVAAGLGNGTMGIGSSGRQAFQLSHAEARIAASEQRIAALERELQSLRTILPSFHHPPLLGRDIRQSTARSSSSAAPKTPPRGPPGSKIRHLQQYAVLEDFSETVFSLPSSSSYPSVVSAGLLQQGEVDLAFQSFKHHFSTLIPLGPFLSISTPTPTHNFVILAILHHVSAYHTPKLADLVDKSLITALSGNTGIDVVLALLILAMAPTVPFQNARPSPLRLISLAYQLGRDLGIDGMVQSYLERGADLVEPFWAEPMQTVQLWTAVVNRYNILHLLHGHGRTLPTSPAPLIPRSPDSVVQHTTNHLQDECHLALIAAKAMRPLMAVEAGLHDFEDVKQSMLQFQAGMESLREWKRGGGSALLDLDQGCLEHIAIARLSFLFQRIPSPLQPIRQTLISGMGIFVVIAQRLLETLFPDAVPSAPTSTYSSHFLGPAESRSLGSNHTIPFPPPQSQPSSSPAAPEPRFPAHVASCAALAVVSLRGTAAHLRYRQDFHDSDINIRFDRLLRADRYLRSLGGSPLEVLNHADEAFGTVEEVMAWVEEAKRRAAAGGAVLALAAAGGVASSGEQGNGSFTWDHGGNPAAALSLFDFDLFSWDPEFLAPDWMPASTPAGASTFGHEREGGSGSGGASVAFGLGAMNGTPAAPAVDPQLEWRNALR